MSGSSAENGYDRDGDPFKSWDARCDYFRRGSVRVGRTTVGDVEASTIWLGLGHSSSGDGPPLIFETMTFGVGEYDSELIGRYSTEEAAMRWHLATVDRLRAGQAPLPGG